MAERDERMTAALRRLEEVRGLGQGSVCVTCVRSS
jgi:hypothetical protein